MHAPLRHSILALLVTASVASAFPVKLKWDAESGSGNDSNGHLLEIYRGESIDIEPRYVLDGTPLDLTNATSVALRYRSYDMASTVWYSKAGALIAGDTGRVTVAWVPTNAAVASSYDYEVVVTWTGGSSMRARGPMRILDTVTDGGTNTPIAQSEINFSNRTYVGVATHGPYRAGTNITFSAANSDGSVDINVDAALSNGITTAYIAADVVLSNSLAAAYAAADVALSNSITAAYLAADVVLSNALQSAYIAADIVTSNGVVAVSAASLATHTNLTLASGAHGGEADTLQTVVTRGGTVTSGAVVIDATNARTNTFGGLLTVLGEGVQSGTSTTASGDASHAEGDSTTASGDYSHAEGVGTTANETASHAEGVTTTASGTASHAEGNSTTASGNYSHAAGSAANATNNNTYVWADGTSTGSTTTKEYTVHADNGIRLLGAAGVEVEGPMAFHTNSIAGALAGQLAISIVDTGSEIRKYEVFNDGSTSVTNYSILHP